MARVQPDWRLHRLAQVREIRTVTHDSIMLMKMAILNSELRLGEAGEQSIDEKT